MLAALRCQRLPRPTLLTIGWPRGCAAAPSSRTGCWGFPCRAARSRCPRCRGARSGLPSTTETSPPPRRRPLGGPARASLPQPCALGGEHSTLNRHCPSPSCAGCDGWPRGRAPQEKGFSVSGAGGRERRREGGGQGPREGGEVWLRRRAEQSEVARMRRARRAPRGFLQPGGAVIVSPGARASGWGTGRGAESQDPALTPGTRDCRGRWGTLAAQRAPRPGLLALPELSWKGPGLRLLAAVGA